MVPLAAVRRYMVCDQKEPGLSLGWDRAAWKSSLEMLNSREVSGGSTLGRPLSTAGAGSLV